MSTVRSLLNHNLKTINHKRNAGFTLIELLVATFIAIIIFGIGFTILNGVMSAKKETETRMRASESARMFFELLERDLNGAYGNSLVPGPFQAKLSQQAVPNVSGAVMEFTTTLDSNASAAKGYDYVAVRYFVLGTTKILYREISPVGFVAPPSDKPDAALFPEAVTMDVNFLQWNEALKNYTTVTAGSATHLDVKLVFQDPNPKATGVLKNKVYWKRIPVPVSLQ